MKANAFLFLTVIFTLGSPVEARKRAPSFVDRAMETVNDALVTAPEDGEVCFEPEESCEVKLWKFIASAQQTLDIAIFDLTHEKIAHEILVASKRVPVRVLVDRRQAKGQHSLVPLLVKVGLRVKFGYQRGIMHNKFTIVDGKLVQTGSFNYTAGAARKNNENQVYLANSKIVARFQKRFEQMWAEGDDVTLKSLGARKDATR